jgi:hypothetical protein
MNIHEDKNVNSTSREVDWARAIIGSILSRGWNSNGSLVA